MILNNEARVRVPNVTTPIVKADVTVLSLSHTLPFRNNLHYLGRNAATRQSFFHSWPQKEGRASKRQPGAYECWGHGLLRSKVCPAAHAGV